MGLKQLKLIALLLLGIGMTGLQAQEALQAKINSLKVGINNLDDIKKLFGEPESLRKGVEWHESATNKNRTMYITDYQSIGLSFYLFTNPSQLYSIIITSNDISVRDIHIGDTLESVRKRLGAQGEWSTTDSQDWWWLEFEKHGLKVGFERDRGKKKYPIMLAKPELVTRLEIYDSNISFY